MMMMMMIFQSLLPCHVRPSPEARNQVKEETVIIIKKKGKRVGVRLKHGLEMDVCVCVSVCARL